MFRFVGLLLLLAGAACLLGYGWRRRRAYPSAHLTKRAAYSLRRLTGFACIFLALVPAVSAAELRR